MPFTISCFPNSYGRFGPDAAIDLLLDAGIEWIEMPIKNAGMPSFFKETPVLTDESSPAEVSALCERVSAAGLKISSCNITSGNPLEEDAFERTLKKLSIAADCGVSLVVAGGGELTNDTDWSTLVDHLRRIGDTAGELGITYCCETHPGVCENAERMLDMLDRVDHEQIRINFDTGNIFYYNEAPDMLAQMRMVMPFVRHVHLKDTNGKFKDWHFPALGEGGAVDFRAVLNVLHEHNYEGPCSLETEGILNEPEMTLEQTHARVIKSMEFLRPLLNESSGS